MGKDLNRSIKIYLDNSSALESADQLRERISGLEKKLLDLQTAGKGNSDAAKKLSKEIDGQREKLTKYEAKVKDTERVLKNLSGATYNELLEAQKAVEKQLKKTARETDLYNHRLEVHKKISREIAIAQKDMRSGLSTQASFWDRSSNFINKYIGVIGTAIAAITGITLAFNILRDERNKLEDNKADLKALTGLDNDSIDWLTKEAKKLSQSVTKEGIRIKESAKEILEAYKLIGSAKPELLSDKEALAEVTEQTLILASASGMKLTDAVDAVTLALNQYGHGADQASRYVNALAAGSKFGAVAVESQTSAIIKSGVSASSANIPIEQLIGTIETLGEKGIKDEIAGTGLKKFFLTLQTGADSTNPKVVGLTTALDNLQKKQLSAAAIKKQFGEEGYNVASVLINEAEKVKYYTDAVTGTSVAMEQAQIKSETASAKLSQAKNKMTDMGIELMEKLNPALLKGLSLTVSWTKKVVELASWLSKNTGTIITLSIAIGGYWAVVKLVHYWHLLANKEISVNIALTKLQTATEKTATVVKLAFAAAIALLTGNVKRAAAALRVMTATMSVNPIVAIGVAIAALAVGIYKLWEHSTKTARAIKEMNKEIANEQAEAYSLFDALKKSNEGTQRRKELIDEINSKYGAYLENQLTEKSTTEDIAKALVLVNDKIRENIVLKKIQAEKENILSSSLEKQANFTDQIKSSSNLGVFVTNAMLEEIKQKTEEGKKYGRSWQQTYNDIVGYIDYHYNVRGKVDKPFWTGLEGYITETYTAADKMEKITQRYTPFLPQKPANELEEVVVTGNKINKLDNSSGSGSGTADEKKQKAELELLLKELDTKHTEELIRLKKFKLDTNQTEAAYNADLRKEEFAHYSARTKVLEEFKKKVSDKELLVDINKLMAEGQDKVMETQMKYRDAVNKLLLDANPLDKEKAAYEERLREVGLFGANIEDLTEAQKKALELLEKQHQDNVFKIKRDADKKKEQQAEESFKKEFKARKTELETEYEHSASSIKMMSGFDFIPEEKIFELQKDLAQKRIDMLKEEADARRKAGLDTIEIQALIMTAEQDMTTLLVQQYQKRWSKYKTFAVDMGTMLGEVIAGSETALADMGIYLINMGLDMLKKQLQIAAAQAMGWSLASPESILTFGVAGIAKGLAIQALIEGVFAAAKAAIGGSLKSKKPSSSNSTPEVSGSQTGSYVTKGNSGFYDGGHTGLGGVMEVAGPVHRNEYVVPAWEMQNPIAMNYVVALEAIRRQRTNTNPLPVTGFAHGGYGGRIDNEAIATPNNPELVKVIHQLASVLSVLQAKGVKAYVVYSDIQKAGEVLDKSRNIGSKS